MLTTAEEARNRVCLMDMVNHNGVAGPGFCRGEGCSAWRWEAARDGPAERLGHCGVIGCVKRAVRKRPRRMVESTVGPP
ncbi:MAG: hypothetical protein ACM3NF_08900 [Gemmatimonadota bacterium]